MDRLSRARRHAAPDHRPLPPRDRADLAQTPEVRGKLEALEFEVVAGSPEQFAQWIRTEIPRWGEVIKATGATAE